MKRRNDLLDHAVGLFPPPDGALQGLTKRFRRRQRNRRLVAGALGLGITLAIIATALGLSRSSAPKPADHSIRPSAIDSEVAFTASDSAAFSIQVFLAHPDGTVTQITHGAGGSLALSWSPDGSRLVVWRKPGLQPQDGGLVSVDASGADPIQLIDHVQQPYGPHAIDPPPVAFSPDGTKVAFQSGPRIFVSNADGTNRALLTDHADVGWSLNSAGFSWSPDGSTIAFARGTDPDHSIYLARVDGSSTVALPQGSLHWIQRPLWSPDGSRIAFTAYPRGSTASYLFVVNADGTGRVRVGRHSLYAPEWSPDGSHIAADGGGPEFVIDVATNQATWIAKCGVCGIDWSPDSSKVVSVGGHGGPSAGSIYVTSVDGYRRVLIADLSGGQYARQPLWRPIG